LELSTKTIDANGDDFIYTNTAAYINEYDAAKLISELQVRILTPDLPLYQTLKDRGKKFVELNGVHYMQLDGIIVLKRGAEVLRVRVLTSRISPSDESSLNHGSWWIVRRSGIRIQVTHTLSPVSPSMACFIPVECRATISLDT
jgi:hypothetical protein